MKPKKKKKEGENENVKNIKQKELDKLHRDCLFYKYILFKITSKS